MSIVTKTLNRIYQAMIDPSTPIYLPTVLLSNQQIAAIISADRKGIDLNVPLLGACTKGSPVGNASLDLLQPSFGLQTVQGADFTATPTNDYTIFAFAISAKGPYVPAHPSDFDGLDVVGPSSLAGISDFPGVKVTGRFSCFQPCSAGGTAEADGQFIATLNNLALTLAGKFYIPDDPNAPMTVTIDTFTIDGVIKDNMTLTLLQEDGTLPPYNINNIPCGNIVDSNFFMAQSVINYPPPKVPSAYDTILGLYTSNFTPNSDSTKQSIADTINSFISQW